MRFFHFEGHVVLQNATRSLTSVSSIARHSYQAPSSKTCASSSLQRTPSNGASFSKRCAGLPRARTKNRIGASAWIMVGFAGRGVRWSRNPDPAGGG